MSMPPVIEQSARPILHWIELEPNTPIFTQLQLEEALLRTDDRNFCIVNQGSPKSIVMGISGEIATLINTEKVKAETIPIIKRFSGGGTVIVDENTLFITFIIQKKDLAIPSFPEPIMRWSADLYASAWGIPGFQLRENDYCIGAQKCGGNAQYIRKERWLHHTSFLWDYEDANMEALLLPPKRPSYRSDRSHRDFLCRLKRYGRTPEERLKQLRQTLVQQFCLEPFNLSAWEQKPHRQSTSFVF